MKKILVLALFIAVIAGCSSIKGTNDNASVTASGTIQKLGMSTFQYGTHLLKADNKTYALKSETVNLDAYLDKKVTIKGKKVEGYPVDGGPELVDVTFVKL
ncbi:lipoprotein [Pedobacter sp. KLB.chiD]|uniref:lipoprotein n=1 Tax=Pedobacter sp. KLB.chiD TaxID=3387402 RepID=UPI00399A6B5F